MHPHLWYPYFQAQTAPPPIGVKSAQGVWLELESGQKIIDCISSWWVNLHGHGHPAIAEAIYQQALTLEQVIFSGFSHIPAEQLATQLVACLPAPLNRVFYSDNGSTAVEVGLKMAWQYWRNQGQTRQTFLSFEGAYHGDTLGTMALGARSAFTAAFTDLLFEVETLPYPATYHGDETVEAQEAAALEQLARKLEGSPSRYAALLIEPLVQGAGGMRMCRPEFLQQVQAVAQQWGLLVIYDEVMTGFGRTGDWFACTKAQTAPDIICLSKGITGGFLPFAATVCSEAIYQAFLSSDASHTLYHGHSYAANPLGCAAALASLALMRQNEAAFKGMKARHWQHLERLQNHPKLQQLRVTGTIAAMDVVTDGARDYLNPIGMRIRAAALEQNLLLRPLGNVLYVMPPYCITEAELAQVYQGIEQVLATL